jgi:hypothetical protein
MRCAFAVLILLACLKQVAAQEARREIRFCPADLARTYPLDSRGRVHSLLTPHIAVINHADAPFTVSAIHVELLDRSSSLQRYR